MIRILYFLVFFLAVVESLTAQWRSPQIHHFGADDGITSGIRDIDQDTLGYMYFATDQGMYRYDGNEFDFFGHDSSDSTSISSGFVHDLMVSQDQKVYLVLFNSFLNVFDPEKQIFDKYKFPKKSNFDTQIAISLAEDQEGNIWIGGENYQLFKFDIESKNFTAYSAPWVNDMDKNGRYSIRNIFPDATNDNILWLTLRDEKPFDINFPTYGLVQFNSKTETFTKVNGAGQIRLNNAEGHLWGTLWGDFITEIDPIQNSTKIHSYRQFYEQNPSPKSSMPDVSADIVHFQNHMLIANGDVLSLDQQNEFQFFYDYPKNLSAKKLFVDNSENLWIGLSEGVDVYCTHNDQIFFYSLDEFGEDRRIYPGRIEYHLQDQSFYMVASTSNNLKQIYKIPHPKSSKSKAISIDLPIVPHAIIRKTNQSLNISGGGKIYSLDILSDRVNEDVDFSHSNDQIPFLYKLISNDNEWVVGFGYDKIIWWRKDDTKQNQVQIAELDGLMEKDFFTNLQFYDQNQLVVTTRSAAFTIDLRTSESQKLQMHMEEAFQYITSLDIDKDQNIWISSMNQLHRFTKDGLDITQKKTYALKEGIKSPTIQEIYIDRGNKLWIFHQSGMDCLDPSTDEIRHVGSREGLPHSIMDPIQIAETDDGYLATNCGNGLIIWHPDSLWQSLGAPPVPLVFQSLHVNGKPFTPTSHEKEKLEFDLPKGPKVISVNYQGLAYPTDKKVRYSYRFANRDSTWISTGTNNQLILSELPYGKNVLEIKSGNPQNKAPIIQAFLNNPTPLLANSWFYVAFSIIILGGLYVFYNWRIRELKKKEKQKTFYNKKVAELELTALRSQMNPHFMFNSMNSIKTYILEAKPDIAADYLSQFSHLIRRILQNSREKRITLEEEIETLRLYIHLEQFRFDHAFEFKIDIDPKINLSEIMIPPTLLQPYVENAIWHGLMHMKNGGRLSLEFIHNSGYISCIIDDNGIGREKARELKSLSARKYKSMGMSITKNRVQLLNTIDSLGITLDIIDKYSQENIPTGTKVILKIPITIDD